MQQSTKALESGSSVDELLEESWDRRGRPVRGRELKVELGITAVFAALVGVLLAAAPPLEAPHPLAIALVFAYAVAARVEFPIGAASFVPTQLFFVSMFVLAPAQLVPLLVLAALVLAHVGATVAGQSRLDRLSFCAGDSLYSLGPAFVVVWLADGDIASASAPLVVLGAAFVAQLLADFVSSALHEVLALRVRPTVHVRAVALMWSVDLALTTFGALAAAEALLVAWAALTPLPVVVLLKALATDRNRKIDAAHARLQALQRERSRQRSAVRRVGEAFASNLDVDALLRIVARAAVETFDGEAVRAATLRDGQVHERIAVRDAPGAEAALDLAEQRLLEGREVCVAVQRAELHVLAARIGAAAAPDGIIAVARAAEFSEEEREMLAYLSEQATVSASNVARHEALQEAEARMRHRAHHDGLTGLANRTLFAERVEGAVARHAGGLTHAAVLFIDLDGFKLVNDTLGHDAGDDLLIAVAKRIDRALRPGDMAARLGGDEFAILLEALEEREAADTIAERLRMEISAPILLHEREVVVRGSVGLAFVAPGLTGDDVLRRADLAMYAAKRSGAIRPVRYHADMQKEADTRMELAQDLHGAAARGELELRLQPILDLASGRVYAGEALARWRHPRRGLLGPAEFVGLAEETGTISELGRFAVDEACRLGVMWPADTMISVNVSATQLRSDTFVDDVEGALRRHGLPAERLVLEMTESVLVEPDGIVPGILDALRESGVTIALDDFGTGYSSLSYLARFPIDVLKLDRSFVSGMDQSPMQARLVAGIVRLAQSLGVRLVAEGIERPAQLAALQDLDVELGQGYLLGVPLEAAAFAQRLTAAPHVVAPVAEPPRLRVVR